MTDLQVKTSVATDNLEIKFLDVKSLKEMMECGKIAYFQGDDKFIRSEIKNSHVEFLKENRLLNPSTGRYTIEANDPIILQTLHDGSMQIVDGNHRVKAMLAAYEDYKEDDNLFGSVAYQVYDRELSQEEVLFLQIRSNDSTKGHTPREIALSVISYRNLLMSSFSPEELKSRKVQKTISDKIKSVFGVKDSAISNYLAIYENQDKEGYPEVIEMIDQGELDYSTALVICQRTKNNSWNLTKLVHDFKSANSFNNKFVSPSRAVTVRWLDKYSNDYLHEGGEGGDSGDSEGGDSEDGSVKPGKPETVYSEKDMRDELGAFLSDEFLPLAMQAVGTKDIFKLTQNLGLLINHISNSVPADRLLTATINYLKELITLSNESDEINPAIVSAITVQAIQVRKLVENVDKKLKKEGRAKEKAKAKVIAAATAKSGNELNELPKPTAVELEVTPVIDIDDEVF